MKKYVFWVVFLLTVLVFVYDMFFISCGAVVVKKEMDRLAEMPGASGVDYWGIGVDILIMGVFLISFFGWILAAVSWRFGQNRVIRILSCVMFVLFILMAFTCALIFIPIA